MFKKRHETKDGHNVHNKNSIKLWDVSYSPLVTDESFDSETAYHHCEQCGHSTYFAEELRIGTIEISREFPASDKHPSFKALFNGIFSILNTIDVCSCLEPKFDQYFDSDLTPEVKPSRLCSFEEEHAIGETLASNSPMEEAIVFCEGRVVISPELFGSIAEEDQLALKYFLKSHTARFLHLEEQTRELKF